MYVVGAHIANGATEKRVREKFQWMALVLFAYLALNDTQGSNCNTLSLCVYVWVQVYFFSSSLLSVPFFCVLSGVVLLLLLLLLLTSFQFQLKEQWTIAQNDKHPDTQHTFIHLTKHFLLSLSIQHYISFEWTTISDHKIRVRILHVCESCLKQTR